MKIIQNVLKTLVLVRAVREVTMNLFSYIVARDYGFAPNPFPPYCTLATCKPGIRNSAQKGDWIIGLGSNARKSQYRMKIIYVMQINEKINYNDYWNDPRFQYKKPVMNGSLCQIYGDNIYHSLNGKYIQENSHHSYNKGIMNIHNYNRDLLSKYVLIAETYWYWGKNGILLPERLWNSLKVGRNYKVIKDTDIQKMFFNWLQVHQNMGYLGEPIKFHSVNNRYNGL